MIKSATISFYKTEKETLGHRVGDDSHVLGENDHVRWVEDHEKVSVQVSATW